MFAGYNYFLIVVTAVVCVLAVVVALYLLVSFQHPEDKNQAWFPKGVVILGISLAIWTVLLFPLDVANRQACSPAPVLKTGNSAKYLSMASAILFSTETGQTAGAACSHRVLLWCRHSCAFP